MNADWTASTYNSPEAIEALSFVRSLVVDGLTPEPGGTFDPATQMSQGNLATFGGGRWPTPALQRLNIVDDVQLVRWPNNAGPATVVGWEGWPILKGSKSKEAAWTFIKYLMTEEYAQAIIKDGASFVPARLSVATSKAFLENAPQNTELLSSHLDTAVPLPAPQRSTECQKLIEEAWLQGITGSKDPETALTEANEKLQELLS
jgi:ABC-type glycerol-3-phosphate transport system substrate-binding protein